MDVDHASNEVICPLTPAPPCSNILIIMNQRLHNKSGAGALFCVPDTSRILLVLRSEGVSMPNTWGIPGGKIDAGETPIAACRREVEEELRVIGSYVLTEFYNYRNKSFSYTTFLSKIQKEFSPVLNWEHVDYGWFSPWELPDNLHPGFDSMLNERFAQLLEVIES